MAQFKDFFPASLYAPPYPGPANARSQPSHFWKVFTTFQGKNHSLSEDKKYDFLFNSKKLKIFSSDMCGPIEKCCCCFPANVGVKFIGMFLLMCDISGMIYSTVILHINNKVSQAVSVITVKTTFLLLAGVSRGAGPRDAELHLVRGGGDLRLLRPHHHQHCSPHRSSQEKQARFSQGRKFVKSFLSPPLDFASFPGSWLTW